MNAKTAFPQTRIIAGRVAFCLVLSVSSCYAISKSASAAVSTSTLCHGYVACNRNAFTTHGYQYHGGTSYWNMYAGNNCTNYVAFVESTVYGVTTPGYQLGNAGEWPHSAALHGTLVNNSPTVGSVAEWDGGSSGIPYPGHVAIVEEIGPRDSYIVISQQNVVDVNDFDWIRINSDGQGNEWEQWPSHFIHFTSAQGSLRVSAKSRVVNIIVKTTPASFSDDVFAFSNGHQHLVTPGLSTGSNAGIPPGDYRVGFHDASLGERYVLHVAVNGPNVKILHQGGPYSTSLPRIGIASSGISQLPSVVTITVRPGRSPLTTTTTSPSSPTSKMAVAPTTTTSMPS